jgi:Uma2 family endonuclease
MTVTHHWTVADLETLPDDGNRYEIIGGELFVSTQPHYCHQGVCSKIIALLDVWNDRTGLGHVNGAPGIIFSDDDAVAPDVTWISILRLASAAGADGKLHDAPELIVEVLSPGKENERRDRQIKLDLYSRRGVQEYSLVNWRARLIDIYRRTESGLFAAETLYEGDTLETSLLPGFSFRINTLFAWIPSTWAD